MKRNASKSVVSLVAAAVFAMLAAGCVSVPSESLADDFHAESQAEVRP